MKRNCWFGASINWSCFIQKDNVAYMLWLIGWKNDVDSDRFVIEGQLLVANDLEGEKGARMDQDPIMY